MIADCGLLKFNSTAVQLLCKVSGSWGLGEIIIPDMCVTSYATVESRKGKKCLVDVDVLRI